MHELKQGAAECPLRGRLAVHVTTRRCNASEEHRARHADVDTCIVCHSARGRAHVQDLAAKPPNGCVHLPRVFRDSNLKPTTAQDSCAVWSLLQLLQPRGFNPTGSTYDMLAGVQQSDTVLMRAVHACCMLHVFPGMTFVFHRSRYNRFECDSR